ncbi:MAG: ECF-type sigma factor [Steroidobacteraceae bacterium]|nr:ECF-type sigma factor [Steroidobacteraceae bacterium]
MNEPLSDVTALLRRVAAGDRQALPQLFEAVYLDLRHAARRQLGSGSPAAVLSPTELVHELYLKLAATDSYEWHDRAHFYRVASRAMRQVMVDRARARAAVKRGDGCQPLELDSQLASVDDDAATLLALHEALEALAARSARLAEVVELRFFAGLTGEQAARVLGVTERTVKRDWRLARAFLHARMDEADGRSGHRGPDDAV